MQVRRDAGLARWRRLQASAAAARSGLATAVAGESFDEAESLQAELDAASAESSALLQQWGFAAEEQQVEGLDEVAGDTAGAAQGQGGEEKEEQEQGGDEEQQAAGGVDSGHGAAGGQDADEEQQDGGDLEEQEEGQQ